MSEINLNPSREKYWEEKDDHEKIIKLGIALEVACRLLVDHTKLIDALLSHRHSEQGDLLQRLRRGDEAEPYTSYALKDPLGHQPR